MLNNIDISNIDFNYEDVDYRIQDEDKIKSWINNVILLEQKKPSNLCYIFCSDEYLLNVNQQYLNHDYYTDIITFDYVEDNNISGDMFISIDRTQDNAKTFGVSRETELNRVIIHGVLHLIGYDDLTDEQEEQIHAMEDKCLKLFEENYR